MQGQEHLFNRWPDCFSFCRNFHAGIPFPVSNDPRCDFGMSKCGTSGDDLELFKQNESVEMRCMFFEEK